MSNQYKYDSDTTMVKDILAGAAFGAIVLLTACLMGWI